MSRRAVDEQLDCLGVAMRLGQRLGAREQRLDPAAQVGRDAAAEEGRVDVEPIGEPGDRLVGRPRLAPLDLADVLLREPVARDLGLGQSGGEAKRAQPIAETEVGADGVVAARDGCRRELASSAGRLGAASICLSVKAVHLFACLPPTGELRLPKRESR